MVDLDTRLRSVIGDRTAKALHTAFGHETLEDLLRHYPRRYVDVAQPDSLAELPPGQLVTLVLSVAEVRVHRFARDRRKFRTEVIFTDGTGTLTAVFFNQRWVEHAVHAGSVQLVTGEVGEYRGRGQLTHPRMLQVPSGATLADLRKDSPIIPIYPASSSVTSWALEDAVGIALDVLGEVPDLVPDVVRSARGLPDSRRALELVHRPGSHAQWRQGQHALKFEEAFVLQAVFARRRVEFDRSDAVARPPLDGGIRERFVERLPFALTAGQEEVVAQISADLSQPHPMHRLLQGEVGSGKTIVALLAMLQVVDQGAQAALLAPTEVLAAQHHRTITQLLGDLAAAGMLGGDDSATRVQLLTGSLSASARRAALEDVVSGAAGIVVGTHALLQESVSFADLGLVVVDEQHRFGVEQRAALVDRARVTPHALVMTATPIPRTVAMTVFGDLEVSTLRELPRGRQPIQTTVIAVNEHPAWLDRAWARVREEVERGRQAYIVASRIGDGAGGDGAAGDGAGDADSAAPDGTGPDDDGGSPTVSLLEVAEQLRSGPLVGLRIEILHGRMDAAEKDRAMSAFTAGQVDVLVATTVIEVGVDVPNATVMIVLDADRFGLSQLHQLRGRIGRGSEPGLCLLVTHAVDGSPARERLGVLAGSADGFTLARADLELRREGDVLGRRQSGVRSSLRLLRVVRDEDIIADAREAAWATMSDGLATPGLLAAVEELERTEQADYLERT